MASPVTGKPISRLRWRRVARNLALAAFVVIASAALIVAIHGRNWMARAIATAPNAGKAFAPAPGDDPSSSQCHDIGVDAHLRVNLGDPDPVSLSLYLVEPKGPPRGTVLVLHGIRSDKLWFIGQAQRVAAEGYRVVLPDLRGHGRSSGEWLSYGVREANDLRRLLDDLDHRGLVAGRVGVVGTSYGAAIAIQLAGIDPRVRAVVAVAPFSSLHAVVPDYARHYLPGVAALIPDAFLSAGVAQAGQLGTFDPNAASPLLAIARTTANVLLIHGQADANIPPSHSVVLSVAAPDHTRLILVPGDDHFSIVSDRSAAISRDGMAWLHRWLDTEEPAAATRP
ncbi:MAG: alpha/beta fold hydrolase [Polyangiaceae bacterium]